MFPSDSDHDSSRSLDDDRSTINRRKLVGITAAGMAVLLPGSALHAARVHDDHGHDDDDDGDDDHRHGDHHDDDDSDDDDEPTGPPRQLDDGSFEVRITDDDADAFIPGTVTIQAGQSITWVNRDDKPHTATGGDWDTGTITPGVHALVTFDQPGTFAYACLFHPVMTGVVVVEGAGMATPAASPVADTGTDDPAVRIFNLEYDPVTLNVAAGTTVTWTNDDQLPHTVTSADGDFDTGIIDAGASADLTFDAAGTFEYVCALHPGMRGTIVVS